MVLLSEERVLACPLLQIGVDGLFELEPWEVREAFIYTPQIGQWRFEEEGNPAGRSPESRPLSSW